MMEQELEEKEEEKQKEQDLAAGAHSSQVMVLSLDIW